jgi:uncharacterized protein YdaU (DUF1376 family)
MGKDPAVLFYTSDFLTGTCFFTMEERGQYITLLCEQHQLGTIPENHMINICKSNDSPVIKKFIKDENGNYYNQRMRDESERRKTYCESRSNNKSGAKKKEIIRKSYDKHMETETETVNENITKDINEVYNSYPSKCHSGRSTGKTAKNRDKIKILLRDNSTQQLIELINIYITDCKKTNTYIKNFGTFLNNLPDIEEIKKQPELKIPTKLA